MALLCWLCLKGFGSKLDVGFLGAEEGVDFSEELVWKSLLWDLAREQPALLMLIRHPCRTSRTLELIVMCEVVCSLHMCVYICGRM